MGNSLNSGNFGSVTANKPTTVPAPSVPSKRQGFRARWSQTIPQSSGARPATSNRYLTTQTIIHSHD